MFPSSYSLAEIQHKIDKVKQFLSIALRIANAHTVEFYTHNVWKQFVALPPEDVLSAVLRGSEQQGAPEFKRKGNCNMLL